MLQILGERRAAVERALGETRLRMDALDAQLAQARREYDQLTGALLELMHLLDLQKPKTEPPEGKRPE